MYVCSLSLFEHFSQLCASLIESDMAADGEVLVIDFELGNQEAFQGIFVRELLLALAVFLHFLVERFDEIRSIDASPNGFREVVEGEDMWIRLQRFF